MLAKAAPIAVASVNWPEIRRLSQLADCMGGLHHSQRPSADPIAVHFPELYSIARNKNESVAGVMSTRPLNVYFRRAIVGKYLKDWLKVVAEVILVSLTNQNDSFVWEAQKNGIFSVNSMYKSIMYRDVIPKNDMIWKLKVIFRGTFWARQWSSLLKEEDGQRVKDGCMILEKRVSSFFAMKG
uniref:Uncharacterized protein n=1 Tax=Oryza sativa subsp. japonica TaxID=39947 RepID=Q6K2K6_ORYSJ|nr:hypothetical protein [Oryza sativa Japonica Group]